MIQYYQIRSPLHAPESMRTFITTLQDTLGEEFRQCTLEEYLDAPFALLFVASGGSEGFFLQDFERLRQKPCYLLTSGESNSLAASMEIVSYLNTHGGRGEILHGDPERICQQIQALRNARRGLDALRGRTLGCIGTPSDWLIASTYDPQAVEKKLGLGYVSIPMEELTSEIARDTYEENEFTRAFAAADFSAEEIRKALAVWGALDRIVQRYHLCGVSVRCFDLLSLVHTTGCLGLSILNSLGIYGGCEGDMPSLLSMAILGSVTGQSVFMCNPSRFDTRSGKAVFAHCTVPVTALQSWQLNTHFESGIGAAVQGVFDEGSCTLFKCSGSLDRYHVQEGSICPAPFDPMLCRTQVTVRLDDFEYFLKNPIHNHHILCKGQHAAELRAFFDLLATSADC